MRVAVGSDEEGPLVESLCSHLSSLGHVVSRIAVGSRWTEVGGAVGLAVSSGLVDVGVVCCWTGTGVSMAANKVPGVRAALCTDAVTAAGARRWNDANVLALSLRLTTAAVAEEMLDAFMSTAADEGERDAVIALESRADPAGVGDTTGEPGDAGADTPSGRVEQDRRVHPDRRISLDRPARSELHDGPAGPESMPAGG